MITRQNFEELDYDHEKNLNLFNGKPFSGIAFENNLDGTVNEVMMVNGIENGICKEWYASGNIKSEGHLYNNIAHGIWWTWNKEGSLTKERIFEFGILVKEKIWDEQGELLSAFEIDENHPKFFSLQIYRENRRSNFGNIS